MNVPCCFFVQGEDGSVGTPGSPGEEGEKVSQHMLACDVSVMCPKALAAHTSLE